MLLHRLHRAPLLSSKEVTTFVDLKTLPQYQTLIRAAGHKEIFAGVANASFYIGAELMPAQVPPHTVMKTVERYINPGRRGVEALYLERWSLLKDRRFFVPYKIRYRTTTQVITNLVILPGINDVAHTLFALYFDQDVEPPEVSDARHTFTSPELYLIALLARQLPTEIPLRENMNHVLRAIAARQIPDVFSFSLERYDPILALKNIDRILLDDVPAAQLSEALSPRDLDQSLYGGDPRFPGNRGFIREIWQDFVPPFIDATTWTYLKTPNSPLALSLFDKGLVGTPMEISEFRGGLEEGRDPRITVADAHLNDPCWLPLVDIFQMSPITDVTLTFNVALDPVEMFLSLVSGARNRFAPQADITEDVISVSDQIIHCIHSETIKLPDELSFIFDNNIAEMTVTKTFDERIIIDFCDLSRTSTAMRHDIIDMAITPLMCYGLAGQLYDR